LLKKAQMDKGELHIWIETLLERGYTIEQIENILGVEITVRTTKVALVVETYRTECLGAFEINMN